MKLIRNLLFLVLLFLLVGCEEKTPEIESYTYTVTKTNVESFFYVTSNRNQSEIKVTLTPKSNVSFDNLIVRVYVYYDFIYDFDKIEDVLLFEFRDGTLEKKVPITVGESHTIRGFVIHSASGSIQATQAITLEDKTYEAPFEHDLDIINQQENLILHQNLLNDLEQFSNLIYDQYHATYSLTQNIDISGQISSESISMSESFRRDPLYIRVYNSETETIVVGNPYRLYQSTGYRMNNRIHMSKTLLSQTEATNVEAYLNDFTMSYDLGKNMTFSYANQVYTMEAKLKDMIDPAEYAMLLEAISYQGLDSKILEDSRFYITYDFTDVLKITYKYVIRDLVNDFRIETSIEVLYQTDIPAIIDVENHAAYVVAYPNSFDLIETEHDFSKSFLQKDPLQSHMYYGYLEKGVYEFYHSNDLTYLFYDEDRNPLQIPLPPTGIDSYMIDIKESGYYYLLLSKNNPDMLEYHFRVTKTNLVDFMSEIKVVDQETVPFIIESNLDYIKLTYDNPHNKAVLKIDADVLDTIQVFIPYVNNTYITENLIGELTLPLKKGLNTFYLKNTSSGHFTFEVIALENIYVRDLNAMKTVPDTFFEDDFYFGGALGNAYFKFTVTEEGMYSLYSKHSFATLMTMSSNTNYPITSFHEMLDINLAPGTYVIMYSSTWLAKGNVYYHKTNFDDVESSITLNRYPASPNAYEVKVVPIYTSLINMNQTHTFHFELTDYEHVFIKGLNLTLMHEDGTLYTYKAENYYVNIMEVLYLKPGKYTLVQPHYANSRQNYTIQIGIIDDLEVDDVLLVKDIQLDETVTLINNFRYDKDIVRIEILEAGAYQITGPNYFVLMDINRNILPNNSINNLPIGTYLIEFSHFSIGNLTISMTKGL